MHILQPKHTRLKPEEAKVILDNLNISPSQLPKIHKKDPVLLEEYNVGDIIKIERKGKDKKIIYYRVVIK
ncbi:MAG: DNA-directed RNA polymerase subunit RpoH/Rpb5 C-terminal domain-containing protein [archaeon]